MAEATAARPRRAAVRGAKPRRAAPPSIPRLPVQVVTMIGLSGGCYALSLALVAGLQSDADATVAAARAPFASGVASIVERNDHLARGLAGLTDLDGEPRDLRRRRPPGLRASHRCTPWSCGRRLSHRTRPQIRRRRPRAQPSPSRSTRA